MRKLLLAGLCLAFSASAAWAGVHKCVDERTNRVTYSDTACRQGAAADLSRSGAASPAPATTGAAVPTRPVPALRLQGSPASALSVAAIAVAQMESNGAACQAALQQRAGSARGTPPVCREFVAQLVAWRAPVLVELARVSADPAIATADGIARLSSVVDALGQIHGHEQFAQQRLGADLQAARPIGAEAGRSVASLQ